jgi:ribosomal protein S18 acetylase RimI-like enzyme
MSDSAPGLPRIELRPADASDVPLLLEIYASTREEELKVVPWSPEQKADFVQMQFNAQKAYYEANYVGAQFQVILADGVAAGRLYTHRMADEIRVMDIAILPAFRNRGIGSKLLKQVQTEAAAEGRKVGIHVEIFNPALNLYERLGFQRVSDRGVYYFLEWSGL